MRMNGWKRWTAAGAVGVVLLVGGLAIGASAASSPPSRGAASQAPADPSQVGPLFGVVHGDLHLQRADGSSIDLIYDRGMITSRSASSITFVRLDGQQVTVAVGPRTFVREGLRPATAGSLRVGERAMFISHRNADGSLSAVVIRCVDRLGLGR